MKALSLALLCVVRLSLLCGRTRGEVTEDSSNEEVLPPVLETSTGKVSGLKEVSTNGNTFYSYYSIPFATPPLGSLRFKDPVLLEPWEGVRDGTKEPPLCPQITLISLLSRSEANVVGEEDCLYLNVFTPKPRDEEPHLPVMVFIHGGMWVSGGALEYPPHVLLNHDVVLVTIQYRLGLLGFMSTEDDVAPGNLGLKDQTMALSWINHNVHKFGGDPLRVTIFGESVGAGSVHYQILTHKSLGLFKRAILQSGSALCSWAQGSAHAKVAQYTGSLFNCTTADDPVSSEGLVECLQDVPAADLVPIFLHFAEWFLSPIVVGPRVDGKYLPGEPTTLMKEARHKRVDLISGISRHDGAFITFPMYANEALRSALIFNFVNVGPVALLLGPQDISPLNQTIKIFDRYLGGVNLDGPHSDNVTQMFTDRFFSVCHDLTASLHAGNVEKKKKKTFQYELTHRGQHSLGDMFQLDIGQDWVVHMDELPYLFTGGPMWKPLEREEDLKLRDLITTMWTNFAATGDPTPDDSLGFKWEPITKDHLRYLALQPQPVMEEDYRNETREFWMSLPLKLNMDLHPERVSNLVYREVVDAEGDEVKEEGETKDAVEEEEEEEEEVVAEEEEGVVAKEKDVVEEEGEEKDVAEEEEVKMDEAKEEEEEVENVEKEGKKGKGTKEEKAKGGKKQLKEEKKQRKKDKKKGKTEETKQDEKKQDKEAKSGKETKQEKEARKKKEKQDKGAKPGKKDKQGKEIKQEKEAEKEKEGKNTKPDKAGKKESEKKNEEERGKKQENKDKQKENEKKGKKDKGKKSKEDKKGQKKDEL